MQLKEDEVIDVINRAMSEVTGDPDITVSLDSSMENLPSWDSLSHLAILVALDKKFNGKVAEISGMATADSVKKILDLLNNNSLLKS